MSFQAVAWAMRQGLDTPAEKLVLMVLADCHNGETGRCDPSFGYIAKCACITERHVATIIEKLEGKSLLARAKRYINGLQTSNHYRLNLNNSRHELSSVRQGTEFSQVGNSVQSGRELSSPKPGSKNQEIEPGSKSAYALPDWLPENTWADFKEHRQRLRKPMTRRAEQLAIAKVERLTNNPSERLAIINQSIEGGWSGLFALKTENTNGRRKTAAEQSWDEYQEFLRGEGGSDRDPPVLALGAVRQ